MTVTPMNWVEAATLAPSVHNAQPWRFHIDADRIDVLFDSDRRSTYLDPSDREAMISIGAAVLNLRMAIFDSGRTPVTTLLPDPTVPGLAARVVIGAARRPDESIRALASAISKRHTNRRPFRDIPIRDEVLEQLISAAHAEGAHLAIAKAEPTIAVLYTAADQPIDWLRAGQALERVLLTATVRGLVGTPITAPVELPGLRGPLDIDDRLRSAQMIVRLGYGDPCAATPRRPVADVVTMADMADGRVA